MYRADWMKWGPIVVLCGASILPASVDANERIEVAAVGGDNAPDGNGKFNDLDGPSINQLGDVAFSGLLIGSARGFNNDDTGIFSVVGPFRTLRQVARAAEPSPGGNGNFRSLTFLLNPIINDAGQVAFSASLLGTFGGLTDDSGLFRGDGTPGSLTQIAREGQTAPGNALFSEFRTDDQRLAFNQAGQVAFTKSQTAIYRTFGGDFTEIVRRAATTPRGEIFGELGVAALNDGGEVAFTSRLIAGQSYHYGIFRRRVHAPAARRYRRPLSRRQR